MADVFKFPNGGYDVKVLRKEDIIDLIDDDTIDKDFLLTLVTECEKDAIEFLKEGRWAGIPFMGSIRIPPITQKLITPESKELISEARANLDDDRYKAFRRQYAIDVAQQVKFQRYFNYIVSQFAKHNHKLYKRLLKKGDNYARIVAYTLTNSTAVESDEQKQINNRYSDND